MYQAAHPDRNMESENIGNNGNVFLADGTTVDLDTPLMPFRKPDGGGAFWTPKDVSNTEQFGYAYPETVKNSTTSDAEEEDEDEDKDERDSNGTDLLARSVSASIVKLYSSSARDLLTSIPATAGTCSELVAADGTFTDWSISTSALVHALPSTFVVRFSLVGDFSSDKPVDVGSWVNMMPSSHEETRKPSAMPEQTYDSSVSITSSLLEQINAGKLGCLERSDVVPFLKDRLSWKVVSVSDPYPMLGKQVLMVIG
jgi:tyrosinase